MARERTPNPTDRWLYIEEADDSELAEMRRESAEFHLGKGLSAEAGAFTCDDCGLRRLCSLAFDPYNTDGDCLYDK